MIIIALALVLIFAVLASASLKLTQRPAYALSLYMFAFADIVVAGLSASLFSLLSSQVFFIAVHILLAAGALAWWFKSGRPALLGPWKNNCDLFYPGWWKQSWKSGAVVWALSILVGIVYILNAYIINIVPPNNNDSMTNHMARVGFWLQHGNFMVWPTPYRLELIYPVNANLQMLWTALFTRSDYPAGFVQWLSAFVGATAIFGLARLFDWKRSQSLFAGLIWMTFPEIVMQSTTPQLDLAVAAFFIAALYFFVLGIQQKSTRVMILAGLTMGLTLGTKQIPVFVAPGMVVLILLVWLKDRKNTLKPLLTWAAASFVFTLLLGSYIYIQNTIVFHNPLGDPTTMTDQVSGLNGSSVAENMVYNSARLFYQSLDFTGMPPVYTDNLIALKARVLKPVFTALGLDLESATVVHSPDVLFSYTDNPEIQEDKTWYGPLSFLLFGPIVIIQLVQGIRRRDPIRLGLIFMFVTYFLVEAAFRPGWDPYQGRYFILALALVAPFTASFIRPEIGWKTLNWLTILLAVVILFNVVVSNSGKPLLSYNRIQTMAKPYTSQLSTKEQKKINALIRISFPNAKDIWDLDRTGRQLLQGGGMGGAMILVNQYVPEDATLALGFTQNMFTFPFFGEHLTRRLIPVYPPERLQDEQWFKENGIQYMILYLNDPLLKNKPSWLVQYQRYGNWGLYYPAWNPPPEIKQ